MDFGNRLIKLREDSGIERKELAAMLEVPYTTLRNYELGTREPGHLFLIKLTKIFNVTVDYLLGLSEQQTPPIVDPKYAPKTTLSTEHKEVLSAYDNADLHDKNLARMALRLPTLKEDTEFGEDTNFKTS